MKISGIPVEDADREVVLKISPQDVRRGATKDPAACAAALACMRQLHATQARVHIGRTYVKQKDKWVRFATSPALRSEIIAFDRGGSFSPGEYRIMPIPESCRPKGKRQGGASDNRRPRKSRKPRAKYHTVAGIRQHGANR